MIVRLILSALIALSVLHVGSAARTPRTASAPSYHTTVGEQIAADMFISLTNEGMTPCQAAIEMEEFMNNEVAESIPFFLCEGPFITEEMIYANEELLEELADGVAAIYKTACGIEVKLDAFWEAYEKACMPC